MNVMIRPCLGLSPSPSMVESSRSSERRARRKIDT